MGNFVYDLSNQVALVTGGSRGQGLAEVTALAAAGARVVATDVLDEEGCGAVRELVAMGYSVSYHHLDVCEESDWSKVVEIVRSEYGRVDLLVNNAGIAYRYGILDTDVEHWQKVFDINVKGVFLGIKCIAPLMIKATRGVIINVSSVAGLVGYYAAAYSASKWAIRGLTRAAVAELSPYNIRVNSIHPGLIETPMVMDSQGGLEHVKRWLRLTPLGRMGSVEEIANLVVFLASDAALYITGGEFTVDGGFSAGGLAQGLRVLGER